MEQLKKDIQAHFDTHMRGYPLFRSSVSGADLWDLYLASFEEDQDPVFRDPNSTSHSCNLCNNFIRRYGNVVAIDGDYNIVPLFDIDGGDEYRGPLSAMAHALRNAPVQEIFVETFTELQSLPYEACRKNQEVFRLGMAQNHKRYTAEEAALYGVVKENEIRSFHHFALDIPAQYVDMSGKSAESIMGGRRATKEVFGRGLDEISLDTLELVRDLIVQGSLLNGDTHLTKVEAFILKKRTHNEVVFAKRENWVWANAQNFTFARFRNELIGVLCTELTQGEDLNKACQNWNKRVDPANYMKAIAPITQKQIAEAEAFVLENGYAESFNRRFATIDDVRASEILHMNVGDGNAPSVSIFEGVKPTKKGQHYRNKFEGVEEIAIEKFMKNVLPKASSVEVFLENQHANNLVTLTTADEDSKPIFKYGNPFAQTFAGNIAGQSKLREQVLAQGGKVGELRFSIMWADGNDDNSDLDAHCLEPGGNEIYFSRKTSSQTGGNLDIDITNPNDHKSRTGKNVVENITYPSLERMSEGTYRFFVHQWAARGSRGFTAELEAGGEIYSYTYDRAVHGNVDVAFVTFRNGELSVQHKLPETNQSRELYGLATKEFHPVNLVCHSPNHWGESAVGDKHYLFMLDGCKADTAIRSFHAVDLIPELQKHRKVLEVLGAKTTITPSDAEQLSGVGFNATVRDSVIVKVKGTHNRVLKINF